MNVVKLVREISGAFGVIDLENDVWLDKFWLDWAKIDTEYFCFRVLIGKIDCPDPSSGTNIEHAMNFLLFDIAQMNGAPPKIKVNR